MAEAPGAAPPATGTGTGTPGSTGDGTPARAPAPKDKLCPYCGQAFTSSSLGRHLDLYIKEKNAKPPDGVHDVDEIRKSRGGITRRQARNSSVRGGSSTPARSKHSPDEQAASPSTKPLSLAVTSGSALARPSDGAWPSAGDLQLPHHDRPARPHGRRDASRSLGGRGALEQRQQRTREALARGKAAELALQEVLDSINAANTRARPRSSPLGFDPFRTTFPTLVLRCLSPPPTIHATQPFPTLDSWSMEPPGPVQLAAVLRSLGATYGQWAAERAASPPRHVDADAAAAAAAAGPARVKESPQPAGQDEASVISHVREAFSHWERLGEQDRKEAWRLEVLRAYAHEREQRTEAEAQLELAQQEIENLRIQLEKLNNYQQPRDFLLNPPATIPLSNETMKQLNGGASQDAADWDHARLVSKWMAVVRNNRRESGGLGGQRRLPDGGLAPVEPAAPANGLTDDEDLMDTDEVEERPRAPRAVMAASPRGRPAPREAGKEMEGVQVQGHGQGQAARKGGNAEGLRGGGRVPMGLSNAAPE